MSGKAGVSLEGFQWEDPFLIDEQLTEEEMGQIELLHKLGQIEPMILKYVTTSQSLYL